MTTRHYGASQPPTDADRLRIRLLLRERVLPERGASASSDRMLDTAELIVERGKGLRYEADKVAEWLERQPLRRDAEVIEAWRDWAESLVSAIADRVMLGGESPAVVAWDYQTTRQTVEDIVRVAKDRIRRSL